MKKKKLSLEHRKKISKSLTGIARYNRRGENHHAYLGGRPKWERQKIAGRVEYKNWKRAVLEKDNGTCKICGSKENIEADHIKPYSLYPELRLKIENGRALCRKCHRKHDNYFKEVLLDRTIESREKMEKIVILTKNNPMTSKTISDNLGFNKSMCWWYLSKLIKQQKIKRKRTDIKNFRYEYYSRTEECNG